MNKRSLTKSPPRSIEAARQALAEAKREYDWYVDYGVMRVVGYVADFSTYEELERRVEAAQRVVASFEQRAAAVGEAGQ